MNVRDCAEMQYLRSKTPGFYIPSSADCFRKQTKPTDFRVGACTTAVAIVSLQQRVDYRMYCGSVNFLFFDKADDEGKFRGSGASRGARIRYSDKLGVSYKCVYIYIQ